MAALGPPWAHAVECAVLAKFLWLQEMTKIRFRPRRQVHFSTPLPFQKAPRRPSLTTIKDNPNLLLRPV